MWIHLKAVKCLKINWMCKIYMDKFKWILLLVQNQQWNDLVAAQLLGSRKFDNYFKVVSVSANVIHSTIEMEIGEFLQNLKCCGSVFMEKGVKVNIWQQQSDVTRQINIVLLAWLKFSLLLLPAVLLTFLLFSADPCGSKMHKTPPFSLSKSLT